MAQRDSLLQFHLDVRLCYANQMNLSIWSVNFGHTGAETTPPIWTGILYRDMEYTKDKNNKDFRMSIKGVVYVHVKLKYVKK